MAKSTEHRAHTFNRRAFFTGIRNKAEVGAIATGVVLGGGASLDLLLSWKSVETNLDQQIPRVFPDFSDTLEPIIKELQRIKTPTLAQNQTLNYLQQAESVIQKNVVDRSAREKQLWDENDSISILGQQRRDLRRLAGFGGAAAFFTGLISFMTSPYQNQTLLSLEPK